MPSHDGEISDLAVIVAGIGLSARLLSFENPFIIKIQGTEPADGAKA